MPEDTLRHFDGEWISPFNRDGLYWIPPGNYPEGCDMISYAKEEFEDRMLFISRRALRNLIDFLKSEGYVEAEMIKTDDDMKEIAHRHLDIIENLTGDSQ